MNPFKKISTEIEAREAIKAAVVCALLGAGVTSLFIIFGSLGASAFIDVAVFVLIAWRIHKGSRAWAVAGLVLFILEKIVQVADGHFPDKMYLAKELVPTILRLAPAPLIEPEN